MKEMNPEEEFMFIHDVDYTHSEAEFEEMRLLLVKSYAVSRKPFNWRLAMAENWNYASRYLEPLSTLPAASTCGGMPVGSWLVF